MGLVWRGKLTISNLSPVPLQRPHLLGLNVVSRRLHDAHSRLPLVLQLLEEDVPKLVPLLILEVGIVDLYVNTRHEGLVERADSVGRDEQDSLVVFQSAEEAGDEVIALHVLHLALFHVYVCLVDEEDGAPDLGHFEPFAQVSLDVFRLDANVRARK
jgi:hypothetical protein